MFRPKSYSAQTGFVYMYYYEGRQQIAEASRYVFRATADRKTWFPVAIVVPDPVIDAWQARNRELTVNERYAVAKLSLMQAFDERQPGELHSDVLVAPGDVETISETLGLM